MKYRAVTPNSRQKSHSFQTKLGCKSRGDLKLYLKPNTKLACVVAKDPQ